MSRGAVAPLPALLFAAVVLPWINWRAGGPSSSVEPWILSAACTAIAYGLLRPVAPRRAIGIALACAAIWIVARSGLAADTIGAAGACLLIFFAAAIGAQGREVERVVDAIAWAWLVAALASTAIALVQYFGFADAFAPWVSPTAAGEAYANLRQRNQFATLTAIGMASLFWLSSRGLARGAALAAIVCLAAGNAMTTSRTGLVEMLMLAALAFAWPGATRDRRVLWGAAIAAYIVAALALPALLEAVTGLSGNRLWGRVASVDSCSSRSVLWSNVLHLIGERPLLGWGWGELDFAHFETLYDGPRFCDILDNAHNLPLHIAVELGVPASIAMCALMAWAVWRGKPWREADPGKQMAWAVLAAIALHSLLEYPLWYGPFQAAAGLALGLVAGHDRKREHAQVADATLSCAPSRVAPWLALAAACACVYAAWDYRRVSQIYLAPEARAQGYRDDPLPEVRKSWLFINQARFAEVTITPLSLANRDWMLENATACLHYSPEPRVVEKVIESATLAGRTDLAVGQLARLRAAFPEAYAQWSKANR